MTTYAENQEHPLGPLEEMMAKAESQQATLAQEQAAERERSEQAEKERHAPQPEPQAGSASQPGHEPAQQQPAGWLQAPQQEGILSHPTPDTNPAAPGKEQHQQSLAGESGDPRSSEPRSGMQRTISTKTQLGAVVTLDGVYVVPRYQTVVKETPMADKVSYMRQNAHEQPYAREPQQTQARSQQRER